MQRKKYERQSELLTAILKSNEMKFCEYLVQEDRFIFYDNNLTVRKEISGYLDFLREKAPVHPDDRWKIEDFYRGKIRGDVEIRLVQEEKTIRLRFQILQVEGVDTTTRLSILVKDITREKRKEEFLEERAKKDSLTSLYNHFFGRELINEYLKEKVPYMSCGMMVIDMDYFKHANDVYGHLFGDNVLVELALLLTRMFEEKDIIMRAGGDEFVVFLKDIGHADLVKKAMHLVRAVRELRFEGKDYVATCSVGVCFLGENISGYTYDELFENADWALYRAKENGRNCYVFCDNLQRI